MITLLAAAMLHTTATSIDHEVALYDPCDVTYTITCPQNYQPEEMLFHEKLEEKRLFFPFFIQGMKVSQVDELANKKLIYTFSLLPRSSGKLLFSPGVLTFFPNGKVAFPTVAITVKKDVPTLALSGSLLPENADMQAALSEKNRILSYDEMAEKERLRLEHIYETRSTVVGVLSVCALATIAAVLLFWGFYEYEKMRKKRVKPIPVIDWKVELSRLFADNRLSLNQRFDRLAHILPHLVNRDAAEEAVLKRLEVIRYAAEESSEEEWEKMKTIIHTLRDS